METQMTPANRRRSPAQFILLIALAPLALPACASQGEYAPRLNIGPAAHDNSAAQDTTVPEEGLFWWERS